MRQPSLFEAAEDRPVPAPPPDQAARDFAVDPQNDVVLEASAGTGKTRVLVDRYVRLIEAGVDPRHILAITFTRKAAAEMRDRVLASLRARARDGVLAGDRWCALRARLNDIQISTIDAFCFSLLREFPLEGDVDPGFEVADETEIGRFANEAMDLTLRTVRALFEADECVRLLVARVKEPVLRDAVSSLLDRRQIARPAVGEFLKRHADVRTSADASRRFLDRVARVLSGPERAALLDDGPHRVPEFGWLARDLAGTDRIPPEDTARVQQLRRRIERHFLTTAGKPRQKVSKPYTTADFATPAARKRHEQALAALSTDMAAALLAIEGDIDVLLARGLQRVLAVAIDRYESLLAEHALLDFAGMLDRAVTLLERQEEFARSRLKLQARHHHLLIDEFQDTSRRQWRLIELLIDAWAEGEGTADAPTSVFVVGDRKQSIYRFRHAEVTLLDEAARRIGALRGGSRPVRQAISTSFRAVPELLAFVNALSSNMAGSVDLEDRWRYEETDRFPAPAIQDDARRDGVPVLGLIAERSMAACATTVAGEVARVLSGTRVRDRAGESRPARPDDIAILFRARAGHQYFEEALESRGIRTYVYKGLGFFDAPEVQDLQALIRYLAQPDADLRAAELLRSRIVRLSDDGLAALSPTLASALGDPRFDVGAARLNDLDRECLTRARAATARWRALADRLPPSELVDLALRESAYVHEMRGRRLEQARENVKKVRTLVRRVENRGYATLGRLATYFETLRAGDDSNAIVEAAGAVNLMTMHASKGLEFPIVFLVNLHAPGRARPTGFSIIERGPHGTPEVAFGSNEATRLEEAREHEELRRLLYVAATRARDRLYLAAQTDEDGRMRRGARSLGSLLPQGLTDLFSAAAASDANEVTWTTGEGSFAFRVCRATAPSPVEPVDEAPHVGAASLPPIPSVPGWTVVRATSAVDVDATGVQSTTGGADQVRVDRLTGTLVHRLFQRALDPDLGLDELRQQALKLLSIEERVDAEDAAELATRAVHLFLALRQQSRIVNLLDSGTCLYEVPFSYVPPNRPEVCLRGVIDCVVIVPSGPVVVLELKTGVPHPEHKAQAALYRDAAAAAFGRADVEVLVCYP
jgi:ATP-dependent exoDNAse (exonuclease V) beta subunit